MLLLCLRSQNLLRYSSNQRSQDSIVAMATMRGLIPGGGKSFFSLLKCPDQASNSMGIEEASLGGGGRGSGRNVTLTTHLQLMPRLRMSGPLLLLPRTPSCRAQYNFTFFSNCISTPWSGFLHQTSVIVDYVTKIFPIFYGTRQFRRVFRRATPVILNCSTRWMQVVNFELRPAYLWEQVLRYPLNRSQGGPHRRSGRCGEEKNIMLLPANKPPFLGCLACCLVTTGLSYTGYLSVTFFFFSPTTT